MINRLLTGLAVLGLAVIAVGCSDDDGPSTPVPSGTPAPVVSSSSPPPPEIDIYGKSYPMAYYNCANKLWSDRVGGWNALPQAKRDSWKGGVAEYMKSKGWPATHQATLEAASTRKVCPAA